jgi:hypothetical protein
VIDGGHRGSGDWKTDGKSFIACCGFTEPDAIDWVMAFSLVGARLAREDGLTFNIYVG